MRIATAVLLAAGCSSGYSGPTITVAGTVRDYTNKNGAPGLRICVYYPKISPQPCATTAADGTYTIKGVPASTNVIASISGGEEFPVLYPTFTPSSDAHYDFTAITTVQVALLTADVGFQSTDDTKGQLAVAVNAGSSPDAGGAPNIGVTVTMSPPSGSGPFYFDANQIPQVMSKLQATTSSGFLAWVNVDPGDIELTFTAPGNVHCGTQLAGWAGSTASALKTRIAAGYGTADSITCD